MLGSLGSYVAKLKPKYDDDVIDRLNYIYTIFVLLIFAITIAAKQYVGAPLQCWVPAQFKVSSSTLPKILLNNDLRFSTCILWTH